MADFHLGISRRFFNKNLKDAIETSGLTYTQLREKTGIIEVLLSNIVNFKRFPKEDARIKLAVALNVPVDDIFPEKYDILYERLQGVQKQAEIKVDFVQLSAPEVQLLESPYSKDFIEQEAERSILETRIREIIMSFPESEAAVLGLRFGLTDGKEYLLKDIAKIRGVSRERVRQIEAKALERLRSNEKLQAMK